LFRARCRRRGRRSLSRAIPSRLRPVYSILCRPSRPTSKAITD
jgi:hypothetical protein